MLRYYSRQEKKRKEKNSVLDVQEQEGYSGFRIYNRFNGRRGVEEVFQLLVLCRHVKLSSASQSFICDTRWRYTDRLQSQFRAAAGFVKSSLPVSLEVTRGGHQS